MFQNKKIGVGIITCNREDYLLGLLKTLPDNKFDIAIIVNDGEEIKADLSILKESHNINYHKNPQNIGVAKSKNYALKYLYDSGCDYLFIFEDDMLVLSPDVFEIYIKASIASGIQHFNYGPGSPFNRVQKIKDFDLHNRHLLDQKSPPNPRMIVEYSKDVKVALYEHTVAMFSMFTREVIEKAGYIDEGFAPFQSWEHVANTYDIIKAGMHPNFWYFADVANSDKLLTEAPGAIENSAIAKNKEEWMKKVMSGREYYKSKYGHYPNQPPFSSENDVIMTLKTIKERYAPIKP